jgi:hypothetical protein
MLIRHFVGVDRQTFIPGSPKCATHTNTNMSSSFLSLCALCGDELRPSLIRRNEAEGVPAPNVFTLSCSHEFHENCIKGWSIVGKRDSCPFCSEKVDLRAVAGSSPWHKQSIMMAQLLDSLRYMLVWNPLIMLSVRFVIWVVGLNETHPNPGATLAPTMFAQ